jgi:hypothetical protein
MNFLDATNDGAGARFRHRFDAVALSVCFSNSVMVTGVPLSRSKKSSLARSGQAFLSVRDIDMDVSDDANFVFERLCDRLLGLNG